MLPSRCLTDADTAAFRHKVTAALANGWSLDFGPAYAFDAAAGVTRCGQAVVEEVDVADDPALGLGDL